MSMQSSVTKSARRASKAIITNGKSPKAAKAKAKKAAPKTKAKKVKAGPSPSSQLVELAVRNLSMDADAFVAKAKKGGIKSKEPRSRAVFARVKYIVTAFKAAR